MLSSKPYDAKDECEKNSYCRMFYHDAVDYPDIFAYCNETADVLISSKQDIFYKKGNSNVIFCPKFKALILNIYYIRYMIKYCLHYRHI